MLPSEAKRNSVAMPKEPIVYEMKAKQASQITADLLILEAPTRFELVMEILQTSALPLGDGAIEKECL